ncbi:MAG: biotin--[Clostridia bacterium]|nr:biotin--[acetyl-CoA-carboxylase] ligase [Clostridia bacterium]
MQPKRNYQIEMEREIARLKRECRRPVLALHSCCAPCSSAVLERLNEAFELVVFYYNPNISPEAEFIHRSEEQKRLVKEMPLEGARVVEGEYDPQTFYEAVRGHEHDPEGGERCGICFELRLRKTAEFARQIGAEYFTTTLSISPLKDSKRLNAIGEALAAEFGLRYLVSDFKKKDGYRRSCALSEEYGLYRQDFCGCVFSKMERERQKAVAEGMGPQGIRQFLLPGEIGNEIEFHEEIGSTNNRARELALQGAPHGTVVLAESQSAGRGRFDRVFHSPKGSGVYFSCILRPEIPAEKAVLLTPMAAVAVARAMEKCADVKAGIKWVNDVYIGGRKACGILCESSMDFASGRMRHVVMGVGVNVGFMEFPDELKEKATSIANECGQAVSRNRFTAELINELNRLYAQLEDGAFMQEYRARSNVIGREVQVLRGGESYPAKVLGISDEGDLIVETENGGETLHSGEISLKL